MIKNELLVPSCKFYAEQTWSLISVVEQDDQNQLWLPFVECTLQVASIAALSTDKLLIFVDQTRVYFQWKNTFKATQMGCAYAMYLRLTNSRFCLIWARMNHFEACLMVYHKKQTPKYSEWQFSYSILMRRKQNGDFNVLNLVWVLMYHRSKSVFFLITFKF